MQKQLKINPSVFKAYDIRGVYPTEINKDTIQTIIKAIYTFFTQEIGKSDITIALGRDMRVSSPELFDMAKKTLRELGGHVQDIGLTPTPTFYFSVLHNAFDAGIQISASHNPKEYNGVKFVRRDKNKILKIGKGTGMERVKEIALSGTFANPRTGGTVTKHREELKHEADAVFAHVKTNHIKNHVVVADAANAMGALLVDEVFKRIPAQLIRMNFELDGTFPAHQPDPLQFKLLKDLQRRVIKEKADLGIAPDGDGDRVFFIDEKGKVIPATLITSLVVREILRESPNKHVLVDIRYTRNVAAVCKKYNGTLGISRVGHALITEQLNRENAIFAGESSGHYYFRETGGGESSSRIILYVLEVMGRENKPLSEILAQLSSSVESGEVNFVLKNGISAQDVINKIRKSYHDGLFSDIDGIAIAYPDWRMSIRSSNTEPLLRLNIEGKSASLVENKMKKLTEMIVSIGASLKE